MKCLFLILTFIAAGEAAAIAQAPTGFKDWKMDSDQMPRLSEIDPNSVYVIRIGHVLLTYEPGDWKRRGLKQKPVKLESMVRVGKAVTVAEPDAVFR